MPITINDIKQAITGGNLSGRLLCIHSSLRSFGTAIEAGPETIIRAFLAEGCTVMVPAFLYGSIQPPPDRPVRRNGLGEGFRGNPQQDTIFYAEEMDLVDVKEMGAIPAAFLKMNGRIRGSHPICSFAALGPYAEELIKVQTPADMLAPLRQLADRGGSVLMMGVGLDRMTLIHQAEVNAGRALFYRWARDRQGQVIETRTSGCSLGFTQLNDVLLPLADELTVGRSLWRVFNAGDVLAAAEKAIRANPMITHCGRPECIRCNDAVAGGPVG